VYHHYNAEYEQGELLTLLENFIEVASLIRDTGKWCENLMKK